MSQPTEETAETGKTANCEKLWREYEHCVRLEQEIVRGRWTFFTALLSVSLVVGGLGLQTLQGVGPVLQKAAICFGWLIFLTARYHYWWFHGKAHDLRDHLVELEERLGITVYRIRTRRPQLGPIRLYYHWAIDILALAYTIVLILALLN